MKFTPLIDMRATTIRKAFFLNALLLGVIAATSIELRKLIEERVETKDLSRPRKVLLTIIGSFLMAFLTYLIIRIIFGYGEGLVGRPPFATNLL